MDKLSKMEEKSEVKRIEEDYNNLYGYNLGFNTHMSGVISEKQFFVNGKLNMKKR